MHFLLIGSTLSGNKGAAAMAESAIQTLGAVYPGSIFTLMSYYPGEDREINNYDQLRVLSAKPLYLALCVVPLSLLYRIFSVLHLPTRFLRRCPEIDALVEADVMLDQGGITFVDGREKYLPFNLATILPAIFMKKRLVKCAQALGPFHHRSNRLLAKLFLPKVDLIVARGEQTAKHLESLGLHNYVLGADYAFALDVTAGDEDFADRYLQKISYNGSRRLIGVSPSVVVEKYCQNHGLDYVEIMAGFLDELTQKYDSDVLIVPHSIRFGTDKTKNNDRMVCRSIFDRVESKQAIHLFDEAASSGELRALIGRCDFFIASRFHAMVSSLAMQVPTLVIGWSHKYEEVLKMFGQSEFALDYSQLNKQQLLDSFAKLVDSEAEVRAALGQNLPAVKDSARRHVPWIGDVIAGKQINSNKG